jgi:hypothetical protein
MLLAKLYLNAQVYIGTAKYNEAIAELNFIISQGLPDGSGPAYHLASKYANLFRADNDTNNTEIIFAQTFDGNNSQAYDIVQVMVKGNAGGGDGGWSGLRTTSAFVNKFPTLTEARAIFNKEDKGQSLEIDEVNTSTQGYGVWKFRDITSTGAPNPSGNTTFPDTDYPMFRLADAYLMYAEAVLRGGTGGNYDALTLVNAIRTRPGDVAAGNAPGAITSGQLTLDFILDERARELYWEGHRRTDLIRFGKYTGSAYLWPWKGGVKNGTGIDDKRAIFPIPAADIANNPNLKQNDGY